MRSIRRSLLGYLLLLVALALGAVGVLVDRLAAGALRDREQAEAGRINHVIEGREEEVRKKFDAELLAEARTLALEMQIKLAEAAGVSRGRDRGPDPGPRPSDPAPVVRPADSPFRAPEEVAREFGRRVAVLPLVGPPAGWSGVAAAALTGRGPYPTWSGFDAPRAYARLQLPEVLRKAFAGDEHPGYFQFDVAVEYPGAPDRRTAVVRPARVPADWPPWPADPPAAGRPPAEYRYDDIEVPDLGLFRRVVIAAGPRGPLFFPIWLPPPAPGGPPGGRRPPDLMVRMYVHAARPIAELDERLEAERAAGDEQLAQVRAENQAQLATLRGRLGLIGGASFLALVVGGGLIVTRGLSPLRRLSHAVSQVSEKDFRLPVEADGLSRELAPIHDRMTTTLDQLRRAFEREKQAVADISHELRTPIASLLATIDVTLRKPRSPDHYRATLEDCRAIAKQLGQLVERIMTLASLDAGTARVSAVRTDAAEVAAGCGTVIRPLAEAHGLSFALSAPDRAELVTDPDRLREVLMNLLHNAVEYNRPGGRVSLAVAREGDRVVFEVADTGIGMTPEVRDRMFERFYRADPSRHATGVHAGLGLAIVREYADRLGGTIGVDSTPGEGTTFRVSFPAPPAPAAEPAPPPRREPAAAGT
jgi:signal transduction histidine kinase